MRTYFCPYTPGLSKPVKGTKKDFIPILSHLEIFVWLFSTRSISNCLVLFLQNLKCNFRIMLSSITLRLKVTYFTLTLNGQKHIWIDENVEIMAVFILEDSLSVWTNLGKHLLLVWLFVSIKRRAQDTLSVWTNYFTLCVVQDE